MSKVTMAPGHTARLSYTNLIEPRAQDKDHPEILTYSTAVLIPKADAELVNAIKEGIAQALAEGKAKFGWKGPSGLKNPLRDGDEERPDDEVYKDHFFLNAKGRRGGKEQPVMLNKDADQTTSASDIYSGVEARLSLQFYPFEKNGNKGVACGVVTVMSMGTGEPLGNTVTVESARAEFGVTSSSPAGKAAAEMNDTAAPAAESSNEDPWAE